MQPVRELNSRFHEGSVSITKDGSVIYFESQESFAKKKKFEKQVNKLILVNLKASKGNG
jgi:hypothetical protein